MLHVVTMGDEASLSCVHTASHYMNKEDLLWIQPESNKSSILLFACNDMRLLYPGGARRGVYRS
jgi:hypothetical protein